MSSDIPSGLIAVPTTVHRLPQTPENEDLIERLLELGVSSLSFLMPEDELARISPNNDAGIAYDDLIMHLPPSVRNELFPASTPTCKERSLLRWTEVTVQKPTSNEPPPL